MKTLFKVFILMIVTLRTSHAQENLQFTFGLSDLRSKHVIVTSLLESDPPHQLTSFRLESVCTLSFLRTQQEAEDFTGRQIPAKFDQMPGFVYESSKPCLPEGETVFLVTDEFLMSNKSLPLVPAKEKQLNRSIIRQIESARGMKTTSAWSLAEIPQRGTISMVMFQPRNDTVLLSLVFTSPNKVICDDYPGDLTNEESRWRVDDGGEYNYLAFDVIAAFDGDDGFLLVTTWAGAEGESASVLKEYGTVFKKIGEGYRYWVPE